MHQVIYGFGLNVADRNAPAFGNGIRAGCATGSVVGGLAIQY